ncbi:MAG: hypothetical protein IKR25_13710 [Muribaculaceae bacterium]|nr:hypothetical protein [Muribaculaceae bacterium]
MPYTYDPRTGEFVDTPDSPPSTGKRTTRTSTSSRRSGSDDGCGCYTWFWVVLIMLSLLSMCT